jgi:NADH-quinone oxidoreductase subunit M
MAFRAPVLAGIFLVTALATLAMPGSGNFVGEILILFGTFENKLVYGLVASAGVVLSAVYMIRLYQGTMHGRAGPAVESREIDTLNLSAVAPLVAIVIALGLYPNFVLHRTERDTTRAIAEASQGGGTQEVSAIR